MTGTIAGCLAIAAPGALATEPFGPTVKLTSHIHLDRSHHLEVVGFYGDHQAVDHRFLRSAESFDFRGKRLSGLELSRVEIFPKHSMTTTWTLEFYGTTDHYDLTTEEIVFDRLPAGARLVRKDTRCWSGSQGSRSCTP